MFLSSTENSIMTKKLLLMRTLHLCKFRRGGDLWRDMERGGGGEESNFFFVKKINAWPFPRQRQTNSKNNFGRNLVQKIYSKEIDFFFYLLICLFTFLCQISKVSLRKASLCKCFFFFLFFRRIKEIFLLLLLPSLPPPLF